MPDVLTATFDGSGLRIRVRYIGIVGVCVKVTVGVRYLGLWLERCSVRVSKVLWSG